MQHAVQVHCANMRLSVRERESDFHDATLFHLAFNFFFGLAQACDVVEVRAMESG